MIRLEANMKEGEGECHELSARKEIKREIEREREVWSSAQKN